MIFRRLTGGVVSLMIAALPGVGAAETLREALQSAYDSNPRIQQQRARLAATDERIAQASAGFKPTITGAYARGRQQTSVNQGAETIGDSETRSLRIEQPLFRGGGTFSTLSSARQQVKAGQFELLANIQQVMLDAVTAYANLSMNQSMVTQATANLEMLKQQELAMQARFKQGTVTRTDVAQTEMRRAEANAQLVAATAQLAQSVATYTRIIGHAPVGDQLIPQELPEIPLSLSEALEKARSENPQFLAAIHTAKSTHYDVRTNESVVLPRVSLVGEINRNTGVGAQGTSEFNQDRVTLQVTVPLYQAGGEYSRIREAKALARASDQAAADTRQAIEERITQHWTQCEQARAAIASREAQVKAAQVAVDGVTQEHAFGTRLALDVLNAQQEKLVANAELLRAQRDHIVAVYALHAALGDLTPQLLGIHDAKTE